MTDWEGLLLQRIEANIAAKNWLGVEVIFCALGKHYEEVAVALN